ncbi:CD209 antigen-like protein C [Cyprinus carpio]|uniref:CD209 antigen-like protein C n=1 Tax=Cyprinus carpio TaxID=7962 RepID=A0A9R0ALY3_CYPCA|nr:CD209 antigen-like protein C [Cyprinus carpio]
MALPGSRKVNIANAPNLMLELKDVMQTYGLEWRQVTSILLDNYAVMRGKNSGLETQARRENPYLLDVSGETVHMVSNAAKALMIMKDTEDFNTAKPQTPQHTGSDGVKIRSSRAAAVCLELLCVLLLTAVIVLCVLIHTKSTNYTQERQQLLTKITNLTEERDQLKSERNELQKRLADGWKCHQSRLYFISSETKNWTESRRYCRERAADLIIINNTEEQEFVKNISGGSGYFWIGLTDIEVEGRWKWVDGSNITSGFWASGEPDSNQGKEEDCALNYSPGWADFPCDYMYKWICEKSVLK